MPVSLRTPFRNLASGDLRHDSRVRLDKILSGCTDTPVITSNCPLPAGSVGTPYNVALTATGGTFPYTWSLVSGMLPLGLTLHPDGTIDGTPLTADTFNFTLLVTDADGCSGSKACSILINPVVEACGYPIAFDWRLNTLAGPFWTSARPNEFFCVGCYSVTLKKLIVFYSADFGETWNVIADTFPGLATKVRSYEARNDDDSDTILIATQEEDTGRVAYSEFDMVTRSWARQNVQVVATAGLAGNDQFLVSVAKKTNGDRVINFTDIETVAGSNYKRSVYSVSSDGGATWGPTVILGAGMTTHLQMGYCWAGGSNRIYFIFHDFGFLPNVYLQTLRSTGVLGAPNDMWPATGSNTAAGRPVFDSANGLSYVPFRTPNPYLATITDADNPVLSSYTAISLTIEIIAGQGTQRVPMDLDLIDGVLYMTAQFADGANPTWFFIQKRVAGVWVPATTIQRVGPVLPQFALTSQIGEGHVIKLFGSPHIALVLNLAPSLNGFQLAPISELPVPTAAESVADWIAACTHL